MDLGCAEFAVPGRRLEEKLAILERRRMWLELANDGKKSFEDIKEALVTHSVPVWSVQAFRQHELQLLSSDRAERSKAREHVEETIRLAAEIGARNVVVVTGYGKPGVPKPREYCFELFSDFGLMGGELGVGISIESLGEKTSFLPKASEVHELVKELALSNVGLLVDTMHVFSGGEDPAVVIENCLRGVNEIQLRDTDSMPPGGGTIEFGKIVKIVKKKFRGLVCIEYKPGKDPNADFELALKTCKDLTNSEQKIQDFEI